MRREEQVEVRIEGTDSLYGKIRLVNFLRGEMRKKHRFSEGDRVDILDSSDDIEP